MDDRILLVIADRGSLPLSPNLIRYLYVLSCPSANLYYHLYTAQIYIVCGISIMPRPRSFVDLYQLQFAIRRVKYTPHSPIARYIPHTEILCNWPHGCTLGCRGDAIDQGRSAKGSCGEEAVAAYRGLTRWSIPDHPLEKWDGFVAVNGGSRLAPAWLSILMNRQFHEIGIECLYSSRFYK